MNKEYLKKELKNLFKSMDYIADTYLYKSKKRKKDIDRFFEIYQQLGLLWSFYGLQCRHWDGYKKSKNNAICKICGKVKGIQDDHYLLPIKGKKVIGKMVRPGKDYTDKATKKEAEIVNDTISFHGARLNVSVYNGYVSSLSGNRINIAADRAVTLDENGLFIDLSKYIMGIKIKKIKKGVPIFGGFLGEIPKRILKKIPIILSYTKNGKLAEIELLR